MQPQQAERLKRLINTSTMLTAQEKQEWLDLLIVMNDKQVSELEAILNTPVEDRAVPPVSSQPLSHISNLPFGISQSSRSAPASVISPTSIAMPTQPKPAQVQVPRYPLPKPKTAKLNPLKLWENKLRRTVEEKELSKPAEEKALPEHAGQTRPPVPPVRSFKPVAPASGTNPSPLPLVSPVPQPLVRQQQPLSTQAKPQSASVIPTKPESIVKIVEPKDIANLNLATMRAMGGEIVATLKQAVANSNYYEVLFYLEKSPLYQAYLQTGREGLNSPPGTFPAPTPGKNLLSKAEFEAFSDLLKSIQFS